VSTFIVEAGLRGTSELKLTIGSSRPTSRT
jgi:hypothetical protein